MMIDIREIDVDENKKIKIKQGSHLTFVLAQELKISLLETFEEVS